MRYRTKVTYLTNGKEYGPGTLLPPDISAGDIAFLRSKGFVEPADAGYDDSGPESGCNPDGVDGFSGFEGLKFAAALKSPDEIMRMRFKKDISAYADSIGCNLGGNYEEKTLKELQEEVIRFQEEDTDEKQLLEEEYDI